MTLLPLVLAVTFRFDPAMEKIAVWGRGAELPRVYFEEWLPALFERTLVFERFEPGEGAVEWIFTGERAGFTVRLEKGGGKLVERVWDSYGLNPLENPPRHPERRWRETPIPYDGPVRSVTVTLDHRLGLAVAVNGGTPVRQVFLYEVRRHQLACTGAARGRLETPDVEEAVVRVDAARRRQTMLGFGGITSAMAWRELSPEGKRRWWEWLTAYNLLLHREYPMGTRLAPSMDNWDRSADATPHYYGDNFPNGEVSDFDYIRGLRKLGGKVLFEFWDLPRWATDTASWARAVVEYCRRAQPDIVGIQNERTQPAEKWHEMAVVLRRELDAAGFSSVRIHMQDASTVAAGIQSARAFRRSEAAWRAIDFTATHMYDYQKHFTEPDAFDATLAEWRRAATGKPFLSTEISVNQSPWQAASYRLALAMGQLYHKNLTLADAAALLYCWLLLNVEQPSYGWTRSLFVPDPSRGFVPAPSSYQLRVFGAYSRRIREGMVRVETTVARSDLLATAFESPEGERTMVLLNRSTRPLRARAGWEGKPFRFLERTDPYHENTEEAMGEEVRVEPGSLVTLSTVEVRKP
jgi:hypothetical protein